MMKNYSYFIAFLHLAFDSRQVLLSNISENAYNYNLCTGDVSSLSMTISSHEIRIVSMLS